MNPCTTKFVLVPIKVQQPPKMLKNDKGNNSFEGETRFLRHQSITIGINIATFGVLLIKALAGTTNPAKRASAPNSVRTRPKTRSPKTSSTPVSRKAAATINKPATVITPVLAKPENACSGVITPNTAKNTAPPNNTASVGPQSFVNEISTNAVTASDSQPFRLNNAGNPYFFLKFSRQTNPGSTTSNRDTITNPPPRRKRSIRSVRVYQNRHEATKINGEDVQ